MTIEGIKEYKKYLSLTNEELAAKSGVPLSTVQKVLGGATKVPRRKTVEALENAIRAELKERNRDGMAYIREPEFVYHVDHPATVEDRDALPDNIISELIDGKLYFMGSPTRTHQRINGGLHLTIANYAKAKGKDCEIYIPPYDVRPYGDDSCIFVPDLTIICDHEKSLEKGCYGAPDWVIEIFSPSTRTKDMTRKLRHYGNAGVKLLWYIDPQREVVIVYNYSDDTNSDTGIWSFDDEIPCALDPELKIRIRDLLA